MLHLSFWETMAETDVDHGIMFTMSHDLNDERKKLITYSLLHWDYDFFHNMLFY